MVIPSRPGRRPSRASMRSSLVSLSSASRLTLSNCSWNLLMRSWMKPSRSVIFLYLSSCGKVLKRSRTLITSDSDGQTTVACASPSPYTMRHVSTLHSVASSLAFFIKPLSRFLNVARRFASLMIRCSFTLLRAMAFTIHHFLARMHL
ncbi:Os03g0582550 [Oryza sativa Japonica Group]|uniref:Os03g0582550 protein n=1 Tax=Oryza sativa subsp. japonica TaxID=39947 RepID=A0A0P0W0H5_ORYSJ|nr:hypothetical protein EE612_018637 [Oryza sativa]BAS85068.1 Os03g0582550 [Oryza sativa Japonica Group]